MSTPQKPIFKGPDRPPFKASETPVQPTSPPPIAQPKAQEATWKPIATAPQDADARFRVRVTVPSKDGKSTVPVGGTETIVCYRGSRKMIKGKWAPALTIIDDRLGTKLGFRPTEWAPLPPEEKKANA